MPQICTVGGALDNKKVPTAPALTDQQRKEGYEHALRLRRQRAEMKAQVARGELTVQEVIADPVGVGMKVSELLGAIPGVGAATVRRWMGEARIPPKNSVKQCGPRQIERLLRLIDSK